MCSLIDHLMLSINGYIRGQIMHTDWLPKVTSNDKQNGIDTLSVPIAIQLLTFNGCNRVTLKKNIQKIYKGIYNIYKIIITPYTLQGTAVSFMVSLCINMYSITLTTKVSLWCLKVSRWGALQLTHKIYISPIKYSLKKYNRTITDYHYRHDEYYTKSTPIKTTLI